MHSRSRATIDPRIPGMPGRASEDFYRQRQTFSCAPSAKRRGMFEASRTKGELHAVTACEACLVAYG